MNDNITLIILPSNSSESNKIGQYTCKLPQPIWCSGYDVGISEVSYTYSWYNIRSDQKLSITDSNKKNYLKKGTYLYAGRYDDIDDLVRTINRKIAENVSPDVSSPPTLKVLHNARKIMITTGMSKDMFPLLFRTENELSELLGIESIYYGDIVAMKTEAIKIEVGMSEDEIVTSALKKTFVARYPYDLTAGVHSLYIYCNVVKHSLVGDKFAQLLRIVEVPNELSFGAQKVKEYNYPQYRSVNCNELYEIEISIKDDTGEDINFNFGRVIVTLALRKSDG